MVLNGVGSGGAEQHEPFIDFVGSCVFGEVGEVGFIGGKVA